MINKSEKLKGPSRSPGAHFVFLTNQRECRSSYLMFAFAFGFKGLRLDSPKGHSPPPKTGFVSFFRHES